MQGVQTTVHQFQGMVGGGGRVVLVREGAYIMHCSCSLHVSQEGQGFIKEGNLPTCATPKGTPDDAKPY